MINLGSCRSNEYTRLYCQFVCREKHTYSKYFFLNDKFESNEVQIHFDVKLNTIGKDFVLILNTFLPDNVTNLSREIICQERYIYIYIYVRSVKGIFPIFKEFFPTFETRAEANESLGEPITNSLSSLSFAFRDV